MIVAASYFLCASDYCFSLFTLRIVQDAGRELNAKHFRR